MSPPPENRDDNEIMWKNMVQPDRPHMALQDGTFFASCVTKATRSHSE